MANRDSEGLEEQQVEQNTNTDSNQPTSEVIGQRSKDDLVNSSSTDAAQAETASSGVAPEDDKENVETDGVEGGDDIDGEDDADNSDEENEEGEDGDDNDGWITPQNISRIREGGVSDMPEGVGVGCMTADFAMQVCTYKDSGYYLCIPSVLICLCSTEYSPPSNSPNL